MVLEQYVFMSLLQNTRALISKKQPPKSILLKGVEAKIIACGKHWKCKFVSICSTMKTDNLSTEYPGKI